MQKTGVGILGMILNEDLISACEKMSPWLILLRDLLAIVEFVKSTMETWAPEWSNCMNWMRIEFSFVAQAGSLPQFHGKAKWLYQRNDMWNKTYKQRHFWGSDMRMSHTHLHHSILHAANHDSSVICYSRTIVYIHLSYMHVQIYFNMIENVSLDLCIQVTYTYIYIYILLNW